MSALQLLALAYQQMPNADQALQQLEAKAGDPKAAPIMSLVLATVYERQQKFDQAIDLYNSLLARNLYTPLARNNLAYLLAEHQPTAENLARAQKLSSETLEENPEEASFLDTMGWILCKQGKYAQAKTYLEKASEHAPGQPAMLYHLGWCEAKLGNTVAARAALQKALESKTAFEFAIRTLDGDRLIGEIGAGRFMQDDRFVAWAVAPDKPSLGVIKPWDGQAATVGQTAEVAGARDDAVRTAVRGVGKRTDGVDRVAAQPQEVDARLDRPPVIAGGDNDRIHSIHDAFIVCCGAIRI